ncbi:MAG: 50S ribosomal protein L25, partial [Bacteroidota bacterium]
MQTVALSGGPREGLGKKETKKVRQQGLIPCVMYGGNEVRHFTTVVNDVKALIYTPDFKVAEITLDGTSYRCILKEVQYHLSLDDI